MEMCITGYGTMENPIHSLWKSKNSFPTSCKQGFPQFHERSQLCDIPTMPAPTESISLSISLLETSFYRPIPAILAKTAFRPISSDCFSFIRFSNTPLYPFPSNEVPFIVKISEKNQSFLRVISKLACYAEHENKSPAKKCQ